MGAFLIESLRKKIYNLEHEHFNELALEVFCYQRRQNHNYRRFLELLGHSSFEPTHWSQIPCLPIELFRTLDMRSGQWEAEHTFHSSGTTGKETSRMPVRSLRDYQWHCLKGFEAEFGPIGRYRLLALLPNYLERGHSGLVSMVAHFIDRAAEGSDFFLHDVDALAQAVQEALVSKTPILLWGVTFALLDLAARGPWVLPKGSIIMETGGMKGRGPELTRQQLHAELKAAFQVPINSEYGMTELQSQAYAGGDQLFRPAATMRVQARDISDPLTTLPSGKSGALNVYDLANVHTCAFLQTQDLGRIHVDGRFEVLGRMDAAIARGCSLLAV